MNSCAVNFPWFLVSRGLGAGLESLSGLSGRTRTETPFAHAGLLCQGWAPRKLCRDKYTSWIFEQLLYCEAITFYIKSLSIITWLNSYTSPFS